MALGAEQRHVDQHDVGGRHHHDAGDDHGEQTGYAQQRADGNDLFGGFLVLALAAGPHGEDHDEGEHRDRERNDEQEPRRRQGRATAGPADDVRTEALADGARDHVVAEHVLHAARARSAHAEHLLARHQAEMAHAHDGGRDEQPFDR